MIKAVMDNKDNKFKLYHGTKYLWSTKDLANKDTIMSLRRTEMIYNIVKEGKQKPIY